MYYAKSATVLCAVGATLIAMSAQSFGAVTSSRANGIDAGGTAGIDAGGINGIDAGGIAGIDAGGINGIDAGGIAGIDAGGINGIDAGGIAGIDAGGINGIDAGGIAGIDAGGINGIDAGGIAGIDAGGIHGASILTGPIDSIDRLNGVFESMGQIVMASQDMLASLNVGDFVSVGGSVVASGWLYADDVSVSGVQYVPGSTEVFVTGMLSSVNRLDGTAQMGGLTIDYTPSLGNVAAPSGLMWSFAGTRSSLGGVMTSDRSADAR